MAWISRQCLLCSKCLLSIWCAALENVCLLPSQQDGVGPSLCTNRPSALAVHEWFDAYQDGSIRFLALRRHLSLLDDFCQHNQIWTCGTSLLHVTQKLPIHLALLGCVEKTAKQKPLHLQWPEFCCLYSWSKKPKASAWMYPRAYCENGTPNTFDSS